MPRSYTLPGVIVPDWRTHELVRDIQCWIEASDNMKPSYRIMFLNPPSYYWELRRKSPRYFYTTSQS